MKDSRSTSPSNKIQGQQRIAWSVPSKTISNTKINKDKHQSNFLKESVLTKHTNSYEMPFLKAFSK